MQNRSNTTLPRDLLGDIYVLQNLLIINAIHKVNVKAQECCEEKTFSYILNGHVSLGILSL